METTYRCNECRQTITGQVFKHRTEYKEQYKAPTIRYYCRECHKDMETDHTETVQKTITNYE